MTVLTTTARFEAAHRGDGTPQRPKRGPSVDVGGIAQTLASHHSLWSRLVEFDPVTHYYARVAAGADYEAWLLTWLPGQGTDWHDHGDSAGSFVVLQGRVSEQVATWTSPDTPPRPSGIITDLGSGDQRTFGRRHLHQVVNATGEPAVSLHVYAPRLTTMTTYAAADGALTAVAVRREGEHW
jgi:mannose-6-phosphate isomerase-like protein (cupin superfamily)